MAGAFASTAFASSYVSSNTAGAGKNKYDYERYQVSFQIPPAGTGGMFMAIRGPVPPPPEAGIRAEAGQRDCRALTVTKR